ncbi:MAG: N-methyl-L-tryptophan oxidase [Phycisphaerales bacterium]
MGAQDLDAIVLGVGTMGASACMHLASRGARVLGIERFGVPHERGSHHGGSRIVRECYFEGPAYVPLLLRCTPAWDALERESAACGGPPVGTAPILHRPGVLYLGARSSAVVVASGRSGGAHGVACETLDAAGVHARFPQFHAPADWCGLFEPGAGFVRPERAVAAFARVARARGARIHEHERALSWEELPGGGVRVVTDRGEHRAGALVLCAGAWTPALAAAMGVRLTPLRVVIGWYAPRDPAACASPGMPVWYIDRGEGVPGIYGIPTAPDQGEPAGVKVAMHGDGTPCDPDAPRVPASARELEAIRAALEELVPCAAGAATAGSTCLYTMSPDGDFVVDRMPGCRRVFVAAGFSGHGFKFAPVVGEILADFVQHGTSPLPAHFLTMARLWPRTTPSTLGPS